MEGSRLVTVVPVENEIALRSRAWVERNRRLVDSLSGGKLAYVWIPNTADDGFIYFNRYYFAQQDRLGAVVDERFNEGGYIADYVVDLLARKLRGYFNNPVADHYPFMTPAAGIPGPKVMLVNEMSGSGGDMLPYMFRQMKLGPLVGMKTWGGLVGIWDTPPLMDGGFITAPRGGFYNLEGQWDVENKGVAPDIEVEETPLTARDGRDPQLERAVAEAHEQAAGRGAEDTSRAAAAGAGAEAQLVGGGSRSRSLFATRVPIPHYPQPTPHHQSPCPTTSPSPTAWHACRAHTRTNTTCCFGTAP